MRADTNPSPPRPRRRALASLALLAALALTASACSSSDDDDAEAGGDQTETTDTTATEPGDSTTVAAHASWVAQAHTPTIEVFAEPDAAEPAHVLDNPNENGAPLVFLIDSQNRDTDWLPVHLPVRPNGTTGFVRAADVEVVQNDYRIVVELAAHQLTVSQNGTPIIEAPIGVGTADTPTPGGTYYIKELLQPPDPNGPYGTHAYGLSGFSNELTNFNGGNGVIGIHGTNEPETIGTDVSHGCIRVTNDTIDQMADVLPLGTPVEIRA